MACLRLTSAEGPLPPHELPMPKRRSVCGLTRNDDQPSSGKRAAHRCHEQAVATAKTRPAHLALEDLQLVAKDHDFDFAVHVWTSRWSVGQVGTTTSTRMRTARTSLPREGGPMVRTPWSRRGSVVCLPFTQSEIVAKARPVVPGNSPGAVSRPPMLGPVNQHDLGVIVDLVDDSEVASAR